MPKKGYVKNRIGEINYNNFGSKMEIVKYNKNNDIDIYFEEYNWIAKHRQYTSFKNGTVRCPYEKTILNIGCIGEGKYKVWENGKHTKYYDIWHDMIKRCYSDKYHKRETSYIDVNVCEEWHNFQNFAEWCEENYYEVEGERIHLDKDILNHGNKIYSPSTCIFVPQRINALFIKSKKIRGDLPIGVSLNKNTIRVHCSDINNKPIDLGSYDTPEEAFLVYKQYKEKIIKQVADEYKPYIPKELYEAMYRYEVEIND